MYQEAHLVAFYFVISTESGSWLDDWKRSGMRVWELQKRLPMLP